MRLEIVQAGDPVLRHRAVAVAPEALPTPFVQELIASMVVTMRAAPGVGLAAPQVGESLQVLVMADDDERLLGAMSEVRRRQLGRGLLPLQVVVNPVLEPIGDEVDEFFEGCLSVTGFGAVVRRWRRVRLTGTDERGGEIDVVLEGWPARIAQHECDHLAGVLYIDVMEPRTFSTTANLARYWKARPTPEVARMLDGAEPPAEAAAQPPA
jgi:peptide deformylase